MEESLLGLPFAPDELNVVHHQQVDFPVLPPEGAEVSLPSRLGVVGGELLRPDVKHIPMPRPGVMADGMEKMSLAKANVSVDVEGIKRVIGVLCYGLGRSVGNPVESGDDHGVESIVSVEGGGLVSCRRVIGSRSACIVVMPAGHHG